MRCGWKISTRMPVGATVPIVSTHDPKRTPAVLVVGGESRFRESLRVQLQNRGLRVYEALSGKAGNVAARVCVPDCVIIAGVLPDADGLDWVRTRREAGDTTRTVFVASQPDETSCFQTARSLGLELVVPQSVDASVLAQRVEVALGPAAVAAHPLGSPPRPRASGSGPRAVLLTTPPSLRSFDEADEESWVVHAVAEARFLDAGPLELAELRALGSS